MSTTYPSLYTGPVTFLEPHLQQDLGSLMKDLSSSYNGSPINSHELELAIASPGQEQFVAIRDNHVIGAGSLSIIPTSFSGNGSLVEQPTAWLTSFIVHESYRGKLENEAESIATQLWETMTAWAKEHGIPTIEFMTENDRGAALRFYQNKGAVEVGTANLYNVPIETTNTVSDVSSEEACGIIYETCKTHVALHLCDNTTNLSHADISAHIDHAKARGISLMQYIAPVGSPAAHALSQAGIELRREEIILRVIL